MSGSKEININSLHLTVLRETENEAVQELDSNFYTLISDFIGKLKREEYDNIEAKIKDTLVNIITNLTSLLLNIRLEKAKNSKNLDFSNLLDEEKFVLDGSTTHPLFAVDHSHRAGPHRLDPACKTGRRGCGTDLWHRRTIGARPGGHF